MNPLSRGSCRSLLAGDFTRPSRAIACKQAPTSRGRTRRAFTLVELLVAAGITVLIAGSIAAIVSGVSKTWTRSAGRLSADAQARMVLDQLELDLQGALFRDDGHVWFAVDMLNAANGNPGTPWQAATRNPKPTGALSLDMAAMRAELPVVDRGKLENARFGTAGVWLRFFTSNRPVTNATGNITVPSAPVAVSYQIVRRFIATNPANTNTGYLLHRTEVRPAASGTGSSARPGVLEAGFDLTASGNAYLTGNNTNNGSQTGDPRTLQVVTTNQRNLDSVIADNVIDFGVRCYVRDTAQPGGLRLVFPATAAGALSNSATARLRGSLPPAIPAEQWGNQQPFPDVVDVMVRILTEEGAAQIANLEKSQTPALVVPQKYNGNAQQWWWGVAMENSRVYTRRIVLNGKST